MRRAFGVALLVLFSIGTSAAFLQRITPQLPAALATLGGELVLQTADGKLRLSALRGKVVLLYFGYTHCPDACPTALATIAAALDRLPADQSAGLFVSLDPVRDSLQAIAEYARFFHPRIFAGTISDLAKLRAQVARFRVDFHYETPSGKPDPNGDYLVDHTSFLYLIAPNGRVVALFDFRDDPVRIAHLARIWLLAASEAKGGLR